VEATCGRGEVVSAVQGNSTSVVACILLILVLLQVQILISMNSLVDTGQAYFWGPDNGDDNGGGGGGGKRSTSKQQI